MERRVRRCVGEIEPQIAYWLERSTDSLVNPKGACGSQSMQMPKSVSVVVVDVLVPLTLCRFFWIRLADLQNTTQFVAIIFKLHTDSSFNNMRVISADIRKF